MTVKILPSAPLKQAYADYNAALKQLPQKVSSGEMTSVDAFIAMQKARVVLETAKTNYLLSDRGVRSAANPVSVKKWKRREQKAEKIRERIQRTVCKNLGKACKLLGGLENPLFKKKEEVPLFLASKNTEIAEPKTWIKILTAICTLVVFYFLFQWITKKLLLMAGKISPLMIEAIPKPTYPDYETEEIKITTSDGAILRGYHFRHKESSEETPTVICFNGNNESCTFRSYEKLMALSFSQNSPANFVVFDYRGTGLSSESPSIESGRDLVKDGDAVYQYVRYHLNPPQINAYGFSLGGGVAAETLALHTDEWEGELISDRSFSSIADFAPGFGWFIKGSGWNLDGATACKKLDPKRVTVLYHSEDPVMKERVRLAKKVGGCANILQLNGPKASQLGDRTYHDYDFISEPSDEAVRTAVAERLFSSRGCLSSNTRSAI